MFWRVVLIAVLLMVTTCRANKKNNGKKNKNEDEYISVENWARYGLPEKVLVEDFKEIINKDALFIRGEYCPFGDGQCGNSVTPHQALTKIIKDTLEKRNSTESRKVGGNKDKSKSTKENIEEPRNENPKESELKWNVIPYLRIVRKNIQRTNPNLTRKWAHLTRDSGDFKTYPIQNAPKDKNKNKYKCNW